MTFRHTLGNTEKITKMISSEAPPASKSNKLTSNQLSVADRAAKYHALLTQVRQRSRRTLLRPQEPRFNQYGEQLYCFCQQPDDEEFMIQCDTCNEW